MAGSFKRVGRDRVRVRLAHEEVAVLRGLPDQLRTVLGEDEEEPVNRRLFPPAYLDVASATAHPFPSSPSASATTWAPASMG